jgi:outer membrane lipoprotein LolB
MRADMSALVIKTALHLKDSHSQVSRLGTDIRTALLAVLALGVSACTGPEQILTQEAVQTEREQRANVPAVGSSSADARRVEDPPAVWLTRRELLANVENWTAFGKLALRSQTDSWSATLQWRQRGDDYRLRLSGPFGAGAVQIEGDPDSVTLRTSDNQTITASSPEELLYQHMGWWLPVSGMRYWILGRTEPSADLPAEQITIDQAGRVLNFAQTDWLVSYLDYQDVDGFSMPRKATLESERVRANLLVSRWQIDVQAVPDAPAEAHANDDNSAADEAAPEQQLLATQTTNEDSSLDTSTAIEAEPPADIESPEAQDTAVEDTGTLLSMLTPEQMWRKRRQALLNLVHWKAFGRVAAHTDGVSWSAKLYWRQGGGDYSIRFSEPLAGGGLELTGTGRRAALRDTQEVLRTGESPEALIKEQLSVAFPVTNLRYWLLGRVRPGIEVEQVFISDSGHPLYFDQDGWRVEYPAYDSAGERAMPTRVQLTGHSTQITIILTGWQTSGESNPQ